MLTHNGRQIKNDVLDYDNGQVMVQYVDTGKTKIVKKSEIMLVPTLADELKKLAASKRTRKNFDAIGERLTELSENAQNCSEALDLIQSTRETVQELADRLFDIDSDNPLLQGSDVIHTAALAFLSTIPGLEDSNESIAALIEEAQARHSEYEEIMGDRGYDAMARDEAWGEMCDAIENIADALGKQ